ncbi:response regulator receiver protein [Candidatus Magnetoovum chiemensis]|nr:response regulator receiver protein [Candidatus Magnetoovum chiemensis]
MLKTQKVKGSILVVDASELLWGSNIPKVFEKVISVKSGKTAFERFIEKEDDISAVLSSWDTDGITGIELLEKIRNISNRNFNVPFVMLISSESKQELLQKIYWASEEDINDIVLKPYSAINVVDKINNLIEYIKATESLHNMLANIVKHLKVKMYDKAFTSLKTCERADTQNKYTHKIEYLRGKIYELTDRADKAASYYKKSLDIATHNLYSPAREGLIEIYIKRGEIDKATNEVQEAIKLSPLNVKWQMHYHRIMLIEGYQEKAEEFFRKLKKKEPQRKKEIDKIMERAMMEFLLRNTGHNRLTDEEREKLRQTLHEAHNCIDSGEYKDALKHYEAALEIDPYNKPNYYASMAFLNWKWYEEIKSELPDKMDYTTLKTAVRCIIDALKEDSYFTEVQQLLRKIMEKETDKTLNKVFTKDELSEINNYSRQTFKAK